jgi:hypothetical protein
MNAPTYPEAVHSAPAIRPQPRHLRDRRRPVRGIPDHREPLRFQQRPGRLAEAVMVIDDQHGRAHTQIVAEITLSRIVASTNTPGIGSPCRHGPKTVARPDSSAHSRP